MHLKYSNGSRQLVHRYIALQGVDPNSTSYTSKPLELEEAVYGPW